MFVRLLAAERPSKRTCLTSLVKNPFSRAFSYSSVTNEMRSLKSISASNYLQSFHLLHTGPFLRLSGSSGPKLRNPRLSCVSLSLKTRISEELSIVS